MALNPYTVVVLYPKIAVDHDDHEPWPGMTYTALVYAATPRMAMAAASIEAMLKQPNDRRGKASDWPALVTFEGHHKPISYAWSDGR